MQYSRIVNMFTIDGYRKRWRLPLSLTKQLNIVYHANVDKVCKNFLRTKLDLVQPLVIL